MVLSNHVTFPGVRFVPQSTMAIVSLAFAMLCVGIAIDIILM